MGNILICFYSAEFKEFNLVVFSSNKIILYKMIKPRGPSSKVNVDQ